MAYLIEHLSLWLFLTAALAAVAGWAFAAERAAPAERARKREREHLLRDLIRFSSGQGGAGEDAVAAEREADAARRMLELRDSRIAELERALQEGRARADEAASEAADLRRRLEQRDDDSAELSRLRTLAATPVADGGAEAEPAPRESELQAWRLRYFEQRVRYLEGQARAAATAGQQPDGTALASLEQRAHDAEASAARLEQEVHRLSEEEAPFASRADIDALLRWRMLYLERRVAHLQERAVVVPALAAPPAIAAERTPDPNRWKWRARYLEARVRHLEQRLTPPPAASAEAVAEPAAEEPPPLVPRGEEVKPPVLAAARNGARDDLTLIEGVSLLQQTTLNAMGVFHFDQIAAWTPENVAWVDQYLRLKGRIVEERWVEQAQALARDGPARRMQEGAT